MVYIRWSGACHICGMDKETIKQRIRERAYEFYLLRCKYEEPGSALGDWFMGEASILNELGTSYTRDDEN